MTPDKIDYPPLLPGGLHPHDQESLRRLGVTPFPSSVRRPGLFAMLEVYLGALSETGIQATIWVAGSFVTEKPNPDDIDAVIIYDESSVNRTAGQQRDKVDFLLNTDMVYGKFGIHIEGIISHNESQIRYYQKLFGTLRDEITPKGIAVLRINHD